MDTAAVGGELMEHSEEQLFWAFQFLTAAVWARFLKLKRIESENRFGHCRAGRILRRPCFCEIAHQTS